MATTRNSPGLERLVPGGVYAVLGMDIVSFSTLHDEDQIRAIRSLMGWISEALAFHSVSEAEYRWSPAGDGGYVSFTSVAACAKAIDVAFSIFDKLQRPDWVPRSGEKTRIRAGLHSGTVQEGHGLGRETNMWGMGINTAARILSLAATSQLLVSQQYFDTYIKERREKDFEVGSVHTHTVKHGSKVEVMNISRTGLGLDTETASAKRWRYIGALWKKTIEEYSWLVQDTKRSGDSVAAIAAAKFLLLLGERDRVRQLCEEIGSSHRDQAAFPHHLFGQMPPELLYEVVDRMQPRILKAGEVLCEEGSPAESCFFPVSGTLVVDVPKSKEHIPIREGQIVGEFSLWIRNLKRTARVVCADDGLVLEMRNEDFAQILAASPEVSNIIYAIVRRRVTANILGSNVLFPNLKTVEGDLNRIPAICEKHETGAELNLEDAAYVLFSGGVRIQGESGPPLDISCGGRFGHERAVGIISEIGPSPDGRVARVLEEAVTVRIDHRVLRDLQARVPSIDNAWNALYGQRLGELRKARAHTA
jgi:class 3 adenylate cyclase/CRP-like cAMP-binding protein